MANILRRRFDFAKDAKAELVALIERLEQQDLGKRIMRQEKALASADLGGRQSIWSRIQRFLGPLGRLNWNQSRISALEQEIVNLRKAFIDVVEAECASLLHTVKAAQGTAVSSFQAISDEFESLSVDVAEHYDRWTADYARGFERTQAGLLLRIDELDDRLRLERQRIQRMLVEMEARLTQSSASGGFTALRLPEMSAGSEYNSAIENYYAVFDRRFGPSDRVRRSHLATYRDDFNAACERAGMKGPIIDLHCGTGELLELLREDGLQAVGLETNNLKLRSARRRGLTVTSAEPVEYLRALSDMSAVAIVGIGIAERLSFLDLVGLMQEASRVLVPGGAAILETPNPRNLLVSIAKFHLDPERIRPLPSEVMEALFEAAGFDEVILKPVGVSSNKLVGEDDNGQLANLVSCCEAYAVVGVKR